ncbi:MAG: hypothetical protein AMXMBFR56_81390 [Polyangiaceae bacterium]
MTYVSNVASLDLETRILLDEYREVGINWRYWGDARFKQLTVFLAATGALGTTAVLSAGRALLPAAAVGMVLVPLFFLMEERATYYRRAFIQRALEIEQQVRRNLPTGDLTFMSQYEATHNSYWGTIGSDVVMRLFFASVFLLWVVSGLSALQVAWPFVALILIGTLAIIVCGWVFGRRLQRHAPLLWQRRAANQPQAEPDPLLAVTAPVSLEHGNQSRTEDMEDHGSDSDENHETEAK